MSNFYKDNPDIEKTLDAIDLSEVAELCEEGFRFAKEYPFAPVDADALRLVVTEAWGDAGERAHVFALDVL